MPEKAPRPTENTGGASEYERVTRKTETSELVVGDLILGEENGQQLQVVKIDDTKRTRQFFLQDTETQVRSKLSELKVKSLLKKQAERLGVPQPAKKRRGTPKTEAAPPPPPPEAPKPDEGAPAPTTESAAPEPPAQEEPAAVEDTEPEIAEEAKGLAKTLNPRELNAGDQVLGLDDERFIIENIKAEDNSWSCDLREVKTGEVNTANETRVRKLLERQNKPETPAAPEPPVPENASVKPGETISDATGVTWKILHVFETNTGGKQVLQYQVQAMEQDGVSKEAENIIQHFSQEEIEQMLKEQAVRNAPSESRAQPEILPPEVKEKITEEITTLREKLKGPAPRTIAIADIHGGAEHLDELLLKMGVITQNGEVDPSFNEDNHVVFTGDLFDRGTQNLQVFERIQKLVEAGRATLIIGNHDEFFLRTFEGDASALTNWLSNGGGTVLSELGLIGEQDIQKILTELHTNSRAQEIYNFYRKHAVFHTVRDNTLFVHGGMPMNADGSLAEVSNTGKAGIEGLKELEARFRANGFKDIPYTVENMPTWAGDGNRDWEWFDRVQSAQNLERILGDLSAQLGTEEIGRVAFGHNRNIDDNIPTYRVGERNILLPLDQGLSAKDSRTSSGGAALEINGTGWHLKFRDEEWKKNSDFELLDRSMADSTRGREIEDRIKNLEAVLRGELSIDELSTAERTVQSEPEPAPEAGTAGAEPTATVEPEAEPVATPTPEASPEPLKISAELKGKIEDAQIALARDLAHNRNSERSLRSYESVKKEVLAELNDKIWTREAAGEKITPELLNEFVALTLTNEALALSDAIRVEKEKVGKGWKERAKHWWRSDKGLFSGRKVRLAASFALLGIAGGAASGGIAPLAAGALTLRGLLGAAGGAEIVQRFYEITLEGKAEKALEKNAEDMAEAEILHNIGVSVLSDQMGKSIPQNKLKAMEREVAERITKEQIAEVTKKIDAGGEITSEFDALFKKIESHLVENVKAIQKEQQKQVKGWKWSRVVGVAVGAAIGAATAMGAAGAEHAPVRTGLSAIGGWVGGLLARITAPQANTNIGFGLGFTKTGASYFQLFNGVSGAVIGGALTGAAFDSVGGQYVEAPAGNETPPAAPGTPTTPEAQPPAGETAPPVAGTTPGAQAETLGTTPPVASETTPGQSEITTPPVTVEFNAQAPSTIPENGTVTWMDHQLEIKDGVVHNVGADLTGDGVADKNIDIKIDDFKNGHGTLVSDVKDNSGNILYEKGTVVQVWDKDWNETASGDAGLVARVNVMKDLDGNGKFETQVGFDKDGTLHWTHQDSVKADWGNPDAGDFRTADGHLDNFAKGPTGFGFQGFEVTGESPPEIAHNLADQWAALHGEATPSAALVTEFETKVNAHPELWEANKINHLWSIEDIKALGIDETKATDAAAQTESLSTVEDKYRSTIDSERMQKAPFNAALKERIGELLTKNVEFKGLDGTSQDALRTAFNSAPNENITVYARLTNGTPERYFIAVTAADGTERVGLITP